MKTVVVVAMIVGIILFANDANTIDKNMLRLAIFVGLIALGAIADEIRELRKAIAGKEGKE